MNQFKFVQPHEVNDYLRVFDYAYPGLGLARPDVRERFRKRIEQSAETNEGTTRFCGIRNDDGELVGAMRLHDFVMQMHCVKIPAGGVGFVAVDFLHKKERVGKNLIYQFIDHYAERKFPIALLYAFRSDFYHQMGFGFGPKMHQYRLSPSVFPKGPSKANVEYLTLDDKDLLLDFYHRLMDKTHGLIEKSAEEVEAWFQNPETRVLGCRMGDVITGYMVFSFKPHNQANFGSNDMHVTEFFYESPEALSEILTMIHSQADQIRSVVLNTQDEYFYHLITDARNQSDTVIPHVYHETNTQGVGLMYRVIDTKELFTALKSHNFNGANVRLKLSIRDSFYPNNDGVTVVHFEDGHPTVVNPTDDYDVELSLDVAHFSSLIMGVIPLSQLLKYGLAKVSDDAFTNTLVTLFRSDTLPVCVKGF